MVKAGISEAHLRLKSVSSFSQIQGYLCVIVSLPSYVTRNTYIFLGAD